MKEEFQAIELRKNETNMRFEMEYENYLGFINYGELGNSVALVHTEVAPALQGTGAAAALVEKTLQYLKDHNLYVLPYCPYVFGFIKKHPEWKEIVHPKFIGYNQL